MKKATKSGESLELKPLFKQLETLPTAIINRIAREKHSELVQLHDGLPALLANSLRVADATWRATRALAYDKYHGDRLSIDLVVALPPMTRTLLESLSTIVFVFDAPNDHTSWYFRSGWVEGWALHDQLESKHGGKKKWREWLDNHRGWLDLHDEDFQITPTEKQKPATATAKWRQRTPKGWWPNPGKMATTAKAPDRMAFLSFLNSWAYSQLSQDSHLSYMGLARRAGNLVMKGNREPYRVAQVLTSATVLVALLSETACAVGLPIERKRLRELWTLLLRTRTRAQDLWDARYRRLLR